MEEENGERAVKRQRMRSSKRLREAAFEKAKKQIEEEVDLVEESSSRQEQVEENVSKKRRIKQVARKQAHKFTKKACHQSRSFLSRTRIHNSPNILSTMVQHLSEPQRKWVRASGFGSLLKFELKTLPHELGFLILKNYDVGSSAIVMTNGNLNISEKDVKDTLGMPQGTRDIVLEPSNKNERQKTWRSQFAVVDKFKITASMVVDKIKESGAATDMFKQNFLVIVTNTLIRSNGNSYVNQDILSLKGCMSQAVEFNWCKYVIENLKAAKTIWERDPSKKYFTGPLAFLILCYVDRVFQEGLPVIVRKCPTFLAWNDRMLIERQGKEVGGKLFGNGRLLQSLKKSTRQQQKAPIVEGNVDVDEDLLIEINMVNELHLCAKELVCKWTEMDEAKIKYEKLYTICSSLYPRNKEIQEIKASTEHCFPEK